MDPRILRGVDRTATFSLPPEGEPETPVADVGREAPLPEWVDAVREALEEPGRYLAYEDSGRRVVVPVSGQLTLIGRSLSAQLRFDDATVSRRHAVIAAGPDIVRVLDDRSLNGVYLNGQRVDAGALNDGDMIGIGRHCIWFLDNARVGEAAAAAPAAVSDR
jgi:pSer/pThr/pTyr-binding forkhead associated (FHA) protein